MSEPAQTSPGGRKKRTARGCLGLAVCIIAAGILLFALAAVHAVPRRITSEDAKAIHGLLGEAPWQPLETYESQLQFIRTVQAAVAAAAPVHQPIPKGHRREPADLIREGRGICYDRSRTIEKSLLQAGLKVRHAAIYAIDPDAPAARKLWSLLTRRNLPSHSVTECLTDKGWMVVDSSHPWLSLDTRGNPVSLEQMRSRQSQSIEWQAPPPEVLYYHSFVCVYGLYSRHGRFYPPFNPIPDVNWRELLWNL